MGEDIQYYEVSREEHQGSALIKVEDGKIEQIAGFISIPTHDFSLDSNFKLMISRGFKSTPLSIPSGDAFALGREMRYYNQPPGMSRFRAGGIIEYS